MTTRVYVLMAISAAAVGIVVLGYPDSSAPLREDMKFIEPAAAKSGTDVRAYVKGEWLVPVIGATMEEIISCGADSRALPPLKRVVNVKGVGPFDKTQIGPDGKDGSRPFTIPPCPPGFFRVASRITSTRPWYWLWTHETTQIGLEFKGEVLPP